jgi:hypothetical protein
MINETNEINEMLTDFDGHPYPGSRPGADDEQRVDLPLVKVAT